MAKTKDATGQPGRAARPRPRVQPARPAARASADSSRPAPATTPSAAQAAHATRVTCTSATSATAHTRPRIARSRRAIGITEVGPSGTSCAHLGPVRKAPGPHPASRSTSCRRERQQASIAQPSAGAASRHRLSFRIMGSLRDGGRYPSPPVHPRVRLLAAAAHRALREGCREPTYSHQRVAACHTAAAAPGHPCADRVRQAPSQTSALSWQRLLGQPYPLRRGNLAPLRRYRRWAGRAKPHVVSSPSRPSSGGTGRCPPGWDHAHRKEWGRERVHAVHN